MAHPPVDQVELCLFVDHADGGFGVRDPDCSVFVGRLLAAFLDQVLDALVDVGHPLLQQKVIFPGQELEQNRALEKPESFFRRLNYMLDFFRRIEKKLDKIASLDGLKG